MNTFIKPTVIALAVCVSLTAITACSIKSKSNDLTAATQNDSQPTPVDSVDLNRYAGTWHEVARLPMYFQRKCVSDVTATYTLQRDSDGTSKVSVLNSCKKEAGDFISSEGIAIPANNAGSKLKVTFVPQWLRWLPIGRSNYWILALDDDYQNAMVGTPDRKYLWLLSRTPVMNDTTYNKYLKLAQQQGYDINSLKVADVQLD